MTQLLKYRMRDDEKKIVKISQNSSQLYGTWNGILSLPVQIKTILSNTPIRWIWFEHSD